MSTFDIRKWNRLQESIDRPQRMTEQEKKTTLEAVAKFNEYTQHVYKTNELKEMIENIRTLAENASKMAIEETADWFDVVSVKRDTKSIGESVKIFEATAKEIGTLQQRMESVFEDIGGKLGKYYEIKELNEGGDPDEDTVMSDPESQMDESEAQDKYQKFFKSVLAKFGVDSPADLDDTKKKAFFNYIDKNHKSKNESTNKLESMLRGTTALTENRFAVINPTGNASNIVSSKLQASMHAKKSGGPKKGWFVVPEKNVKKARALFGKHGGNFSSSKFQEEMFDVMYESKLTEGFGAWDVVFAKANVSGVQYDGKTKYSVKARNTSEAIKKAVKQAGGTDSDWMAVDVKSLSKK